MEIKGDKANSISDRVDTQDVSSQLYAAAYKDTQLVRFSNDGAKSSTADKYLPAAEDIFNFDLDIEVDPDLSAAAKPDQNSKEAQIPSERKGFDPRAAADPVGSPGWNDFSGKQNEVEKEKSLLDNILDFLKPDYSAGDSKGGAASHRDILNDVVPARALNQDSGGGGDTIAPVPLSSIVDVASNLAGAEGKTPEQQQAADERAKNIRDDQAKAKAEAQKQQDERDKKQKEQDDKEKDESEKERSEKEQKDSDDSKKGESAQSKDDDKKDKDGTSRPNPDAEDRPQLTQAERQAVRDQLNQKLKDGLTNPGRPGSDERRANAPKFGGVKKDSGNTTNPQPDNDGNSSAGNAATGNRPAPKVDVRRGF